jgi:integrase-like protein
MQSLCVTIIQEQQAHLDALQALTSWHHLSLTDGHWSLGSCLIIVGHNSLKRGIISLYYDFATAGHPGISKTMFSIVKDYWWPSIRNDVTEYVKGCGVCQATKPLTTQPKPPLYPIVPEPGVAPFKTIALDFITKLPPSRGHDTILTITDHDCSKVVIFLPCHKKIDAAGVAKLYSRNVFPHYGIPKKVISDRDTCFTTEFTKELCHVLDMKQNMSTIYHLQTNRQSK